MEQLTITADPVSAWAVAASEIAKIFGPGGGFVEFLRWTDTEVGKAWMRGVIDGQIQFAKGLEDFGKLFIGEK